jgi:hypothetical protein
MKKYPTYSRANAGLKEAPAALDFPAAPDFVSHPPRIDPQAMLQRIAENMAWRDKRSGEGERRAAEKISAEFTL